MFGKGYAITLNRVHDTISIREGNETLKLTVDGDAMRLVAGLNKAQQKMVALNEESTDEEIKNAARFFAGVIFGNEQAEKLLKFYADDPSCVISVCGKYFKDRLAGKIAAVQKKMKV